MGTDISPDDELFAAFPQHSTDEKITDHISATKRAAALRHTPKKTHRKIKPPSRVVNPENPT